MKLAIYNEKCLVVLSTTTKQLVIANGIKCWIDKQSNEGYEVLDAYIEIRTRMNYHPLMLYSNPALLNDGLVFTNDGRNGTHLIENLKFI